MQSVNFLNIQKIFYEIYQIFSTANFNNINSLLVKYWPPLALVSTFLSFLLLILLIYLIFKLKSVEKEDAEKYGFVEIPNIFNGVEIKNDRWMTVLNHLEKDSPSDWKSAILEADIILDKMTKKMGYHGDSLGERLRGVESSDFLTLDKAWEAHKTRNLIAHKGSDYILTKREAKKIIDLYRQVFEEFEFI